MRRPASKWVTQQPTTLHEDPSDWNPPPEIGSPVFTPLYSEHHASLSPCIVSAKFPPTEPASPARPEPEILASPHAQNISDAYNFEDWNVAFEVESTLYRVHKFFFRRESPVFAAMFENHASTNEDFIPLPSISGRQFEALLQFMYSSVFEPDDMTLTKWTAILHLANIWSMTRVRNQAIKALDAMKELAPVDKIVIAAEEGVAKWVFPAYSELVGRPAPLSVGEARKLISLGERPVGQVIGMDIVPLLAQAREHFRNSYGPYPFARDRASRDSTLALSKILEEAFGYPTVSWAPSPSHLPLPLSASPAPSNF